MRGVLFSFGLVWATSASAQGSLKMGEPLPAITLAGEQGESVKDGSAWSSASLVGKVSMVLYVDPDEGDANEKLTDRLKTEAFPPDKFQSTAIINMAATWKPNVAISQVLKSKQEKFPLTVYVKDYKKVLHKEWGLKDDAFHVLLLDPQGRLIFDKAGEFSHAEIEAFVRLIKDKTAA